MALSFLIPIITDMMEQRDVFGALEIETLSRIQSRNTSEGPLPKLHPGHINMLGYWAAHSGPVFTTSEYSLMPFDISTIKNLREDEIYTGESTLYEADLKCHKAGISKRGWGYVIGNGNDCEYHLVDIVKVHYASESIPSRDIDLMDEMKHLVDFSFYAS